MFVNTLAIANHPNGHKTFKGFLKEIKTKTLEAFENQEYPFDHLVERVVVDRDTSRNPLFDAAFLLQNVEIPDLQIPGLELVRYPFENKIAKFDLTLQASEIEIDDSNETLTCALEYCTRLFKPETIDRFIGYFRRIMQTVLEKPGEEIGQIEIISGIEKREILEDFNATGTEYPKDKTIGESFEEQLERTPDRMALVGKAQSAERRAQSKTRHALTYRELNKKSDQLAHLLRQKGVEPGTPDSIVAIMMEPSVEMIIGLLGILKAGGAYLPIDPAYPKERINYMLKDSNAGILVSEASKVSEDIEVIELIKIIGPIGSIINDHRELPTHPTHPAYTIYTSGTTGRPKGTLISHYNVVRVVKNTNYIKITQKDRMLQLSNYAFDGSVFDIYGALLNGAALVLAGGKEHLDVGHLSALIKREAITLFFVTTALFNTLVDIEIECFKNIRKVLFGGERVSVEHSLKALEYMGEGRVLHMYGPTETTVYATYHVIDESPYSTPTIPIGKPISNTFTYILDRCLKPVPVGVEGEIYIGGDGVGKGYLNNAALTHEKFIRSPYVESDRLYKTGDLARWLPNGSIEFIDRIDHQVKIRGFRIELGEIENRLLEHEAVKQTIVVDLQHAAGDRYLCAYVVPHGTHGAWSMEHGEGVPALKEFLSHTLPDYMIPSFFVPLDKLPLTANGKVDRRALPEPEIKAAENRVAPRDAVEEKLAEIWTEVLGIEKNIIGIDANFFELGGHSLKATVLLGKMNHLFKVNLHLADILKFPTIGQLAAVIKRSAKTTSTGLEPIEERDYYELSFNQKRLWFIHQMASGSSAFHMPGTITFNHKAAPQLIRKALQKIVKRHESFRTGFTTVNHEPAMFIVKEIDLPFAEKDLSALVGIEKERERRQVYLDMAVTPFELDRPPLIRTVLVTLDAEHYELMYNIHHIIADGWSLEILQKEFYQLVESGRKGNPVEPEPLAIQYKDFAAWHNKQLNTSAADPVDNIKQSHLFWKEKLGNGVPVFELASDFIETTNDQKGAACRYKINKERKEKLKKLARQNETNLFMVMFALYIQLLLRFSGQKQVTCSIIAAGREHADLQKIIGFFVNAIIFTAALDENESFSDYLHRIQADALEMLRHQDYPLELVFDDLKMKYPNIPVSFNMINFEFRELTFPAEITSFEPVHFPDIQEVKYDIEAYVTEYKNGIDIYWSYKKSMFRPATIEYIGGEYIRLIDYFTTHFHKSYKDYRNTRKKRRLKRN
jgi:amino acid adenylation domain-containing protein